MIIRNNIVWLKVNEKAKSIYSTGMFNLFCLADDGTEFLIDDSITLSNLLNNDEIIAIEVGELKCSRCGQSELIDQDCITCNSCMEDLTGDIYERGNLGL